MGYAIDIGSVMKKKTVLTIYPSLPLYLVFYLQSLVVRGGGAY